MSKKYDSISYHEIDVKDLLKNNPEILRSLKAIRKLDDQKLQTKPKVKK